MAGLEGGLFDLPLNESLGNWSIGLIETAFEFEGFVNQTQRINETDENHLVNLLTNSPLNWSMFLVYLLGLVCCGVLLFVSAFERSGLAGPYRTVLNQLVIFILDQVWFKNACHLGSDFKVHLLVYHLLRDLRWNRPVKTTLGTPAFLHLLLQSTGQDFHGFQLHESLLLHPSGQIFLPLRLQIHANYGRWVCSHVSLHDNQSDVIPPSSRKNLY